MARKDPFEARAVGHLMELLAIEGLSGQEGEVAKAVREKLESAGCKPAWIRHDTANKRIPGDYEVGNLIVKIPGNVRAPTQRRCARTSIARPARLTFQISGEKSNASRTRPRS